MSIMIGLVKVPFIRDNHIEIQKGKYNIYLSQINTLRLPSPYSSNCSNMHVTPNIFSAKYSESACFQQCVMNDLLQKCGDVTNIFKNLDLSQPLPLFNITDEDRRECIMKAWGELDCRCPLSCAKTEYDIRVLKIKDQINWEIYIFNSESKVTHIQQVPDYTLGDLLGDAGGILGLAIGASCLSVLELFVYFVMFLSKKMY